jgi:hypothetical protein
MIAANILPIRPSVDPVLAQVTPVRADVAMIIQRVLSQSKNRSQRCKEQQRSYSSFHIASLASGLNLHCRYKHRVQVKVAGI